MLENAIGAKLVVLGGVLAGEVFRLDRDSVSFGRETANTICCPDPALSRRHCEFLRTKDAWVVRDLASANGTFVNGAKVADHTLVAGDRILLGDSVVLLYLPEPTAGAELTDDAEAAIEPTLRLELDEAVYLKPAAAPNPDDVHLAQGLRVLLTISTAIHAIRSEQELYHEVLRLLFDIAPASEGAIVLAGEDEELRPVETLSSPPDRAVRISRTAVTRALAEGAGVLSRDTSGAQGDHPGGGDGRSLLAVPMTVRTRVMGAIYLASSATAAFSEDHLQLVIAVARIAAIALDNVRHVAALEHETARLQADVKLAHDMVGESATTRRVYDRVARVARTDCTVLITGETGTGKELAARAIHLNSKRARRPFVAINCAALTESLLESELFGHERGAFTGAVGQKRGKLELADGGSIFLDEVGELAPPLQAKVLRVLQERVFERVGGTRPIQIDVRLISATNRMLPAEVTAGRFREDLYFRLNVVCIEMPPLRERRDDIPLLARHFLSQSAPKCGRRLTGISREAMAYLTAYAWPGNVRELANAIERAAVLGTTEDIVPEDLPETITESARAPAGAAPAPHDIHATVVETKKRAILAAFRKAGGNYTETARLLAVHPNYLHRLIRNLGLKSQLDTER